LADTQISFSLPGLAHSAGVTVEQAEVAVTSFLSPDLRRGRQGTNEPTGTNSSIQGRGVKSIIQKRRAALWQEDSETTVE
jgi:hypothetical protein